MIDYTGSTAPMALRQKPARTNETIYYEDDDGNFVTLSEATGKIRQNAQNGQRIHVPVPPQVPVAPALGGQQQQVQYNNDMLFTSLPNVDLGGMAVNAGPGNPFPDNRASPRNLTFDFDFPFDDDLFNLNFGLENERRDPSSDTVPDFGPARKGLPPGGRPEWSVESVIGPEDPLWGIFTADDTPPVRAEAVSGASNGEDVFLEKILEVFPDISREHVKSLYKDHKANLQSGQVVTDIIERVIEDILADGSYPKHESRKRKRTPSDLEVDSEEITRLRSVEGYATLAIKVLSREFPIVPLEAIKTLFSDKKSLSAAYEALYRLESSHTNRLPYERLRRARQYRGPSVGDLYTEIWDVIERELKKAKKSVAKEEDAKKLKKQIEAAELQNEREHAEAGTLMECQCCFSDAPVNRMIPCEGEMPHFFCFKCVKTTAETQIGLMKYEMNCFDVSGCQAVFDRDMLKLAVGEAVMEKLESLQQLDEIGKAGLEGLEDCPFCNFKAVCPPIENDREFRCLNPDCEKISCRLCKDVTHTPKSCEEAKKEKGIPERRAVEEAMTQALIRICPRCKLSVIKENGCNKMQCVQCHCLICDVCKKDITRIGYNHFARNGCPLYENDQGMRRQREEVKQAERAAIEKILASNSHLDLEALRVKDPERKKDDRTHSKVARQDMQRRFHVPRPAMPVDVGAMAAYVPARHAYPVAAYPVRFVPEAPPRVEPPILDNRAVPVPLPGAMAPGPEFGLDPRFYHPDMYGPFGYVFPNDPFYPPRPFGPH